MTLITASSRPAPRSQARTARANAVAAGSCFCLRASGEAGRAVRGGDRAGFTLIDLLVSLAVMAVLMSLLLPSLAMAREATNRYRCASNMKQMGAALVMYASDNGDLMPYTVFGDPTKGAAEPQNTLFVHLQSHMRVSGRSFDGLGLLVDDGYIDRPEALYCPSHTGMHTFNQYAANWGSRTGIISGNYQYRLFNTRQFMSRLDPWTAIIADGMRTPQDYNHGDGHNMLTNDMAVRYVGIETLPESLALTFADNKASDIETAAGQILASWAAMDRIGGGDSTPPVPVPGG